MRSFLQKLYFNTWIRLPVKFILTFTIMKVTWDYQEYLTNYRKKKVQPRLAEFDTQSPANPEITPPYLWYKDYEGYQDLKHWHRLNNDTLKKNAIADDRDFVLTDHPYRENRNYIDQLMMRAKEYSCSEHIKFFIIGEYAKTGENIPQGVYKDIRAIHQPEVQISTPIIPKL